MTPSQICQILRANFREKIRAALPEDRHPRVHVTAEDWPAIAKFLRYEPALSMDWLANLSGVDYAADEQMCVVYDLWSTTHRHTFALKAYVDRRIPKIESVAPLWAAANWHEREAFDLFGIEFVGHPDLRRILCADDWVGHPLRKDYEFPVQYHGIPGTVPMLYGKIEPAKPD